MKITEAQYRGYKMVGDTMVVVDRVTERCVYVDGKKQEDRITVGGVPISRISGFGVIGGTVMGSISVDVFDTTAATVKSGVMVVAKDCGPVNVRALDDFGKQTTTTFATSIEVCGDAQEIISAGIAATAGRTSATTASSRKDVAN
jgi:CheY-specific phosphatase CheX